MFLISFCDVHWLIPFLLPALLLFIPYLIFRRGWRERIAKIEAQRQRDSERLAVTEGELNLSQGKLLALEDKLATLTATNRRLETESHVVNADPSGFGEEIAKYRQKITSLEGELALKNGEEKIAENKYETFRKTITRLEGELALTHGEVKLSEDQHDAYRRRITQLEGELALKSGELRLGEYDDESDISKVTAMKDDSGSHSDDHSYDAQSQEVLRQRIVYLEGALALAKGDVAVNNQQFQEQEEKINDLEYRLNQARGNVKLAGSGQINTDTTLGGSDFGSEQGNQFIVSDVTQDHLREHEDYVKSKKKKAHKKKKKRKKAKKASNDSRYARFKQAKAGKFSTVSPNDLTVIEGIGPKAASILVNNDIDSWESLSMKTPAELKEILSEAGSRYSHMDPSTWPRQANLAAGNHWTRLKTLQDKIGTRREQSTSQSDSSKPTKSKLKAKKAAKIKAAKSKERIKSKVKDTNLQIIEGIGPKMSQLMAKHELSTWSALAVKSPGEIRLILDEYGDKYKIIDPKGWPKQASYAAKGKWKKLINYQKADGSESKAEKMLIKLGAI